MLTPESAAVPGWLLFLADLEQPVNRFGTISRTEQPEPPLSLESLWIASFGRVASNQGVIRFGPVIGSAQAPPELDNPGARFSALRALEEAPGGA